ncbi:helix-turn-helix domain-containing protein [Dyadobacter pollutisoli]|uniref:Helix-turn-helix transcriptional regulator n=1 Tax=Dyadobacter pollutisoli TaxID=2910158 RepID=A0A9E8NCG8_9BACT|nr:helix-turn-helix transcriptional regulator [Dyadobacter pollutisoli]WAC12441.1 helix-turn-helix transcriptional regulator [Dyadobacter pollutisoli]
MKDRYSKEIIRFGERVREIRLYRNMIQLDLGEAIGMERSEISKIENGKKNVEFNTMVRLAEALTVELSDFFSPVFKPL